MLIEAGSESGINNSCLVPLALGRGRFLDSSLLGSHHLKFRTECLYDKRVIHSAKASGSQAAGVNTRLTADGHVCVSVCGDAGRSGDAVRNMQMSLITN